MANNLRKFANEAEYSAATLNYPAVSWIVSGDTVHYDKTSGSPTPVVNDKVIIASYSGEGETDFIFFNCEASSSSDITAITLDDVAVVPITCQTLTTDVDASQLHIAKYDLNTTTVDDWLSGDLGCGAASEPSKLDVLIPSQIEYIASMPTNAVNLVIEATTPPDTALNASDFNHDVYVPDSALSTYHNHGTWSDWGDFLKPISQYSGNLPIN